MRTSYLPSEILWGYRFEHRCVAYDKALNKADSSENKIIELEMELKVVGDNMKCMEVC